MPVPAQDREQLQCIAGEIDWTHLVLLDVFAPEPKCRNDCDKFRRLEPDGLVSRASDQAAVKYAIVTVGPVLPPQLANGISFKTFHGMPAESFAGVRRCGLRFGYEIADRCRVRVIPASHFLTLVQPLLNDRPLARGRQKAVEVVRPFG